MSYSDSLRFIKAVEFLQGKGFRIKIYMDTNVVNGTHKASCSELIEFAKKRGWEDSGDPQVSDPNVGRDA